MTHARKITRQFGTAAHDNLFEAADLIGGICAGGYIYLDDGSTLRIVFNGCGWYAQELM